MRKAIVISVIVVVVTMTIGFGLMSSGVALAQGTDNPPGVPALRVIAPSGAASTMVGSMHIAYHGLRQPAPSVLDGARALVIEHTTHDEKLDLKPAPEVEKTLAAGKSIRAPWAQFLSVRQVERLHANFACNLPQSAARHLVETLLRTSSPRLASSVAYLPCSPRGKLSRDQLMEKAARERGVPTIVLETQDDMDPRRRSIPDATYLKSFRVGIDADLSLLYERAVAAFNRGDYDTIAALSVIGFRDTNDKELFQRVMVAERNAVWLPKLRKLFDGGNVVVVVGASHFPGNDGLIALLQENGYRVEPIRLPEDK